LRDVPVRQWPLDVGVRINPTGHHHAPMRVDRGLSLDAAGLPDRCDPAVRYANVEQSFIVFRNDTTAFDDGVNLGSYIGHGIPCSSKSIDMCHT
jgi:hypothetical protein